MAGALFPSGISPGRASLGGEAGGGGSGDDSLRPRRNHSLAAV